MRLYKTITFIYSKDMTFTISEYGLWCITEILCTFLVFCLPAVPKIIIESKPMARIASFFDLRSTKNTSRPDQISNSRWPAIKLGPMSKSGGGATGASSSRYGRGSRAANKSALDDTLLDETVIDATDADSGRRVGTLHHISGSRSESQEELRQHSSLERGGSSGEQHKDNKNITRTTEFITSEEYITTTEHDKDLAMRAKLGINRL